MLHVTEADVKRLLPFPKAVELAREAYSKLAKGEAVNPHRVLLSVPGGASMFFMPAHVYGEKTVSVKVARVNAANSKVSLPTVLLTVYVYNATSGVQVAEVEGEWLTVVRTGASSAVATDLLAEKGVESLGIFGSGRQALGHILALSVVRDFSRVMVYSRDREKRERFAKSVRREYGIPIVPAVSAHHLVAESDVIVTATTSQTPVFDGHLVNAGSCVIAVGSGVPDHRELDTRLVTRSNIVVDSRAQALSTYGDIMAPIREKVIREKEILELGEIMTGKSRIEHGRKEVILFKAGGLAVLDAMTVDYLISQLKV